MSSHINSIPTQSISSHSHSNSFHLDSVKLLKRSRREGDITNVLPQMVKQLEVSLYRSAPSFKHYVDQKTLKKRLQKLASEISRDDNAERKGNGGGGPPKHKGNGPPPLPGPGGMGPGPGPGPGGMRGSGPGGPGSQSHYRQGPPSSSSSNNPMTQSSGGGGKDLVNLGNVNSNMMGAGGGGGGGMSSSSNNNGIPTPGLTSSGSGSNSMAGRKGHSSGSSGGGGTSDGRRGESQESKDRLRKQQQRLLLLHHSSKCQAPDGTCKATQYCREMKRLWSHMAKCEDYNCRIQHCYSSRTILSHYRKCKDQNCQICKPVRQSVWNKPKQNPRSTREPPPPPPQAGNNPSSSFPPGPPGSNMYAHPVNSSASSSGPPPPNPYPPPPPHAYPPQPPSSTARPTNHMPMPPSSSANQPDRKATEKNRIIHKQQRLLLLRHASKCTAPEGQCTVTQHCGNMKRLWQHISTCAKKDCDFPHCISSRYVLMHYRKCKDSTCASCQPVRIAINKQTNSESSAPEPINSNISDNHTIQPTTKTIKRPREKEPMIPAANGVKSEVSPDAKRPKRPVEDTTSTLLKSLTVKQIELHIQSLSRVTQLPAKSLKEKCSGVLKVLMNHDDGWVFNSPVDPVNLGIPDYFEKIKKPMDLGTIHKRLENGSYREIKQFDFDVRLTFDNAMLYNEPNTPVHEMAKSLKALYIEEHKKLFDQLKREEDERRLNDRACILCGCEKLQFEPPVFFCSGLNCQSKRIHRNRHFYVGGNSQYNWCTSCYTDLDDSPIHMQDLTLRKKDLVRKKNDEINEENWVQCDACDRWVHQICGLFNPRQNKHDDSVKYTCPKCLLDERKKPDSKPPDTNNPKAEDLPRTKFSEWLETYVLKKLKEKHIELAKEKVEVDVSRSLEIYPNLGQK